MPAPQNTTLGFNLPADQFDEVAADLRAKGVTFEDYDVPEIGLKTVNGIADFEGTKAAWFKAAIASAMPTRDDSGRLPLARLQTDVARM